MVVRYTILVVLGFIMMAPFLWLITTSLKPEHQVFLFPPKWIPDPIMWSNYTDVLTKVPFMTWFGNTLKVTGLSLLGTLISATLVAYGFARVQFRGKDFWFMVLVATMMLPNVVTMIPTFILFSKLKWIDTFLPMIVPAWFGGTPFYIFLIRQYMTTLPMDLEEAASIDGASSLMVFLRIITPLCKPVLGTVGIFSFIANWNDFMRPMLYLNTPEKEDHGRRPALFSEPVGYRVGFDDGCGSADDRAGLARVLWDATLLCQRYRHDGYCRSLDGQDDPCHANAAMMRG